MPRRTTISGRYRRALCTLAAVCFSLPFHAGAAPNDRTPFEQFAEQRGTRIASAVEVGRMEDGTTRAVFVAIVLENPRHEPGRMRGLRIDLESEAAADRIYLEAGELVYLNEELGTMACGVARDRQEPLPDNQRVTGIAACRPSNSSPPSMCPSYYRNPDGEGFGVGTRGAYFQFPGRRPGAFRNGIAAAMVHFDLDDTVPAPEPATLPDDVLGLLVAAAVESFPQLVSSPGIRAAGYSREDDKSSATLVFQPYSYAGELGRSMLVRCDASGVGNAVWRCDRAQPRSYLTIPDQDREVVILGEMTEADAWMLITMARQTLANDIDHADVKHWRVPYMTLPDEHSDFYSVVLRDDAAGDVGFEFKSEGQPGAARFSLSNYRALGDGDCD